MGLRRRRDRQGRAQERYNGDGRAEQLALHCRDSPLLSTVPPTPLSTDLSCIKNLDGGLLPRRRTLSRR